MMCVCRQSMRLTISIIVIVGDTAAAITSGLHPVTLVKRRMELFTAVDSQPLTFLIGLNADLLTILNLGCQVEY